MPIEFVKKIDITISCGNIVLYKQESRSIAHTRLDAGRQRTSQYFDVTRYFLCTRARARSWYVHTLMRNCTV